MKEGLKFKGTVRLWLEDEDDEFVKEINKKEYHNLIVYTGINFIYDLLSNQIEDYYDEWTGSPNIFLHYIALGTSPSTNDNSEVGVQLTDWRLTMEGDGEHTLRTFIDEYLQEDHSLTMNARFPSHLFPYHPYDVWEMGTFLDEVPPLENPEIDETQKPHTMFNRIVFPERYQVPDGFTLKAEWELELSSTMPATSYAYLFYDDFDNYLLGQTPYLWDEDPASDPNGSFECSGTQYQDPPYSGGMIPDPAAAGEKMFTAEFDAQFDGILYFSYKIYVDSGNNNTQVVVGIGSNDFTIGSWPSNGIVMMIAESTKRFIVVDSDGFNVIYDYSGDEDRWYNFHYTINLNDQTYHLEIIDTTAPLTPVYEDDHDFGWWGDAGLGLSAIALDFDPSDGDTNYIDGVALSTSE